MSKAGKNEGGRPEHQPTAKTRRTVAIAAGAGMSHADIATGLSIARGTLEKHYAEELTTGAFARRLDVIEGLYDAATAAKPNVTAAKAYMAIAPKLAPPPPKPVRGPKLGKKEQAALDAQGAGRGTDWDELLPRTGEPLQ